MEWAEDHDADYIFGLAGNAALYALAAEAALNLRFHHAMSSTAKLRTYASFLYQAGSWSRPRSLGRKTWRDEAERQGHGRLLERRCASPKKGRWAWWP
jgi:hypothetical protein